MRHYVITGVLVIVLAIVTYAGLMAIKLMPVQASAQSVPHRTDPGGALHAVLLAVVQGPRGLHAGSAPPGGSGTRQVHHIANSGNLLGPGC